MCMKNYFLIVMVNIYSETSLIVHLSWKKKNIKSDSENIINHIRFVN